MNVCLKDKDMEVFSALTLISRNIVILALRTMRRKMSEDNNLIKIALDSKLVEKIYDADLSPAMKETVSFIIPLKRCTFIHIFPNSRLFTPYSELP
jgi:hypothetical protein